MRVGVEACPGSRGSSGLGVGPLGLEVVGCLGGWLVLGGWVGGCVGLGLCRVLCCVCVWCLLCTCLFSLGLDSLVFVCVVCVWFVSVLILF